MHSWIMTFRAASPDRTANLRMTMAWLSCMPFERELIIVEQDDQPRLQIDTQAYNYPVHIVHAYNPGLFNRSWGFNVGVRHAAHDKLFFADSDMIMQPAFIVEAAKYLDRFGAVSPMGRLIDIDAERTRALGDMDVQAWPYDWPGTARVGMSLCSGIVAYRRDALAAIHGWDERFEGWGCEDLVQWFKTRDTVRWHAMQYRAFHLHHERSPASGSDRHPHYAANLELFHRYKRDPALLRAEGIDPNRGDIDRYRNAAGP